MKFFRLLSLAVVVSAQLLPVMSFAKHGMAGQRGVSENVVVRNMQGTVGSYLTDSRGRSLYMFEADSLQISSCYGTCAHEWPPFLASDEDSVRVEGSVTSELIGTTIRSDGTRQVTYNGMPLYYYIKDQKPGDITGQGVFGSGALWFLVRPDGIKLS